MRRFAITAALCAALAAATAGPARAQSGDSDCISDASDLKRVETKVVNGVTYILTKLKICVQPKKPLALVVSGTKGINYEWENQKPNFLRKVHESLSSGPF